MLSGPTVVTRPDSTPCETSTKAVTGGQSHVQRSYLDRSGRDLRSPVRFGVHGGPGYRLTLARCGEGCLMSCIRCTSDRTQGAEPPIAPFDHFQSVWPRAKTTKPIDAQSENGTVPRTNNSCNRKLFRHRMSNRAKAWARDRFDNPAWTAFIPHVRPRSLPARRIRLTFAMSRQP